MPLQFLFPFETPYNNVSQCLPSIGTEYLPPSGPTAPISEPLCENKKERKAWNWHIVLSTDTKWIWHARRGLVAACEARTRRKEPLQTACVCTRILRRMAAPIAIGLGPPFPKYICRKPHEFLYRYVQHDHNQFCDVEIISGRLFLPLFLPKGFANICIRNLGMGDVSKALT